MGVEKLNEVLREHCPQVFKRIPLDEITMSMLPIDAEWWLTSHASVLYKDQIKTLDDPTKAIDRELVLKQLIDKACDLIATLLYYRITPVWVTGKTLPEKKEEHIQRAATRQATMERYQSLVDELIDISPFDRDSQKVEELVKLYCASTFLGWPDMNRALTALEELGFPVKRVEGEAEAHCSALARAWGCGVLANDTDCHAFGAPRIYYKLVRVDKKLCFESVAVADILQGLNMTREQFVDMCILLGCDFNSSVKGIGHKTAHKAIKDCVTLEAVQEVLTSTGRIGNRKPVGGVNTLECLKYPRMREIFALTKAPRGFSTINWRVFLTTGLTVSKQWEVSCYNKIVKYAPQSLVDELWFPSPTPV